MILVILVVVIVWSNMHFYDYFIKINLLVMLKVGVFTGQLQQELVKGMDIYAPNGFIYCCRCIKYSLC